MLTLQNKTLMRATALVAITAAVAFGLAHANPGHSQPQAAATYPPGYEFDVATFKPSQDTNSGGVLGFLTEDSYRARNMTLMNVMREAYGLWGAGEGMISGGPKWLDTDRYYITAKLDPSVADKLRKLNPDQRKETQQLMVQALLADRLKLAIHREAREFPVYSLTIAKSGLKLHEAKPGDPYTKAFPYADKFDGGADPAGKMFLVGGGGPEGRTMTIYGFGVSMLALTKQLTLSAGQIVQDKTGLTGNYDFTLKYWFTPMRPASDDAPDGQPSDPAGGPSLFSAIQQELGLKLQSTKGPVQIVVIDHVERPSVN